MVAKSLISIAVALASILGNADSAGLRKLENDIDDYVYGDRAFKAKENDWVKAQDEQRALDYEDDGDDWVKAEETVEMGLKCKASADNEKNVGGRSCEGGFKEILKVQLSADDLAENVSNRILNLQSSMMPDQKNLVPKGEAMEKLRRWDNEDGKFIFDSKDCSEETGVCEETVEFGGFAKVFWGCKITFSMKDNEISEKVECGGKSLEGEGEKPEELKGFFGVNGAVGVKSLDHVTGTQLVEKKTKTIRNSGVTFSEVRLEEHDQTLEEMHDANGKYFYYNAADGITSTSETLEKEVVKSENNVDSQPSVAPPEPPVRVQPEVRHEFDRTMEEMDEEDGVHAKDLTKDNMKEWMEDNEMAFIDFFAPWCVWCQRLAPTWEKFAVEVKNLNMPVGIGKVDCMEEVNLCRNEKIMAFPTLRWYEGGKPITPDYNMDKPITPDYNMDQTVQALTSFAKRKLEMNDKFKDWEKGNAADGKYFYYNAADGRTSTSETSETLQPEARYEFVRMDDDYDYRDYDEVYGDFFSEDIDDDDWVEAEENVEDGVHAEDLTKDSMTEWINHNEMAFIVFSAPSWCRWSQLLAPTWEEFAVEVKTLNMPVGIGKVDCMEEVDLCRDEKIMAFPTLRWYEGGKPITPDYRMDRTVQALTSFTKRKLEMNAKFKDWEKGAIALVE